jgi:hypothetical protein
MASEAPGDSSESHNTGRVPGAATTATVSLTCSARLKRPLYIPLLMSTITSALRSGVAWSAAVSFTPSALGGFRFRHSSQASAIVAGAPGAAYPSGHTSTRSGLEEAAPAHGGTRPRRCPSRTRSDTSLSLHVAVAATRERRSGRGPDRRRRALSEPCSSSRRGRLE